MLTVREIATRLHFDNTQKMSVSLYFGDSENAFNPLNPLQMAAFGDFVVDDIYVSEGGVGLALKQEFVKAGA